MKVETVSYRCDVCSKATSNRWADGWVTVSAFKNCQCPKPMSLLVGREGSKSKEAPDNFDLCSRECAATWLFGAP